MGHRGLVAPILRTARGSYTEIAVGAADGPDHLSVVKCESITTIGREMREERIGALPAEREWELRQAILDAFALFTVDLQ